MTVEDCYLVGVLLGDGYIAHYDHGGYRVGLHVRSKVFADEFLAALNTLRKHRVRLLQYKTSPSIRAYKRNIKTDYYVEWHGKKVYLYFSRIIERFKLNWHNKRIGKNRLFAFLKGLFDSEGTCYYASKWNIVRLTTVNTNEDVVTLASAILTHLGFNPRVYYFSHKNPKYKVRYSIVIAKRKEIKRFIQWARPLKSKRPRSSILPQLNSLGQKRNGFQFLSNI